MTQTYRTDDGAKWGTGKGSNLTPTEVDINFWDVIQRVVTLEALPSAAAGIDHFSVVGTQFYVIMTDATTLGPYTLPISTFNARGVWAPSTSYAVMDTFTINGSLYVVLFAHTSGLTFDAGANDGLGHDYYSLMIETPGSSLPTGGATGQILQKVSGTDYNTTWGWKTPTGGTARQYLIKINSTQDNAEWDTPEASDIHFTPVTGSTLTSDNVADTLEELATSVASVGGGVTNFYALDDVNVIENSGHDGYVLYWDNAAGFWQSKQPIFRDTTVTTLGTTGTVSLDPSLGNVFEIFPAGTITIDSASTAPGAEITLIVYTVGTSSFNITFGTNFKSQGVLATGTVSGKAFAVKFVGDSGTYGLVEVSRTTAM